MSTLVCDGRHISRLHVTAPIRLSNVIAFVWTRTRCRIVTVRDATYGFTCNGTSTSNRPGRPNTSPGPPHDIAEDTSALYFISVINCGSTWYWYSIVITVTFLVLFTIICFHRGENFPCLKRNRGSWSIFSADSVFKISNRQSLSSLKYQYREARFKIDFPSYRFWSSWISFTYWIFKRSAADTFTWKSFAIKQ